MGNYNCSCATNIDQKELTIDLSQPNYKDLKISLEDEKDNKDLLRNWSYTASAKTGYEEDHETQRFFQSIKAIKAPDPPILSTAPYNVLAKKAKKTFYKLQSSQLKESDFVESKSFQTLVNDVGIYVGDLIYSETRHGKGIQYWKNGGMYEGDWKDNQMNGFGRMIFSNGDIYKGEWKASRMHGNGKYIQAQDSFFDGNWFEGVQEGYGEEICSDSSEYKGNYLNGKKCGKGVYKGADGTIYTGEFLDDKMEGEGVMVWPDKREYRGQWKKGLMHGIGEFIWPDGRKYNGEYKDNVKEGYGEFFYGDGRAYRGLWKGGIQHGIGSFTTIDNKGNEITKAGEWFSGKRIRWLKSLSN